MSITHGSDYSRSSRLAASLILAVFFILDIPSQVAAQLGDVPQHPPVIASPAQDGMTATVGDETIHVSVCRASVIHFVATLEPSRKQDQPWMLASNQSCPGAKFQFTQAADAAVLTTESLKVELSLKRGNITISTLAGQQLLRERNSLPRTYEPDELNRERTYHVEDRFAPDATEAFYGLGQHQSGMFNYRGSTVELGQNNTDVAIPLLISSKGYGLMWNTAALTYFDNRFPLDLKLTSIAGKSVDYYFLYGPEVDVILHEYRCMTGHTPMLPKWAYGFFQSKDRYVSLDEIREIAERYRQEHIPLDAMVQDWFWWKTEGDPIFNSNYHDVAQDLAALHKENVHAMISVWGLLDPKSQTYKLLEAKHELLSDAHVYDATNPEARDIYWEHLPGK